MKYILPRTIYGNRGDIASRWGVLKALRQFGVEDVIVYRQFPSDIPDLGYRQMDYHGFRNFPPSRADLKLFRQSDVIFWAVGLDMQDDSSLMKLMYLWVVFRMYRAFGLKVVCLFQGAGPIQTRLGRILASQVLRAVDLFVARDPGTAGLVGDLGSHRKVITGHDGIFLPGFEEDLVDTSAYDFLPAGQNQLIIGLNLRQWYHFTSSLLPYQFAKRGFEERSSKRMEGVIRAAENLILGLRQEWGARILLLSAYQPGVVPWEDDLPWLEQVKSSFRDDSEVVLIDLPLTIPEYFSLVSRLDLMIGMRLHSTLTALRFGVPSINISYTLKGGDILAQMGLAQDVVEIDEFVEDFALVKERADFILADLEGARQRVAASVDTTIRENNELLGNLIRGEWV